MAPPRKCTQMRKKRKRERATKRKHRHSYEYKRNNQKLHITNHNSTSYRVNWTTQPVTQLNTHAHQCIAHSPSTTAYEWMSKRANVATMCVCVRCDAIRLINPTPKQKILSVSNMRQYNKSIIQMPRLFIITGVLVMTMFLSLRTTNLAEVILWKWIWQMTDSYFWKWNKYALTIGPYQQL